ncbi:MAG TPA: 4-(cytidine 5'-diphospho)-2-C-methyl-D-erythritol kinase [Beijerinckiaceae bacterium]|nr:4-(cytidine 5'-diphospho)-2-C-methyl-D-erythritol kinase [Beijerinckiaceae bacterium]
MQKGLPWLELAPAKVNLSLHVVGRRDDGYHALESLVAFADLGDSLTLEPDRPLALAVTGPGASSSGPIAENLVMKAVEAMVRAMPGLRLGALSLTKLLPVAAGLGGGSADAAAALRLLGRLNGIAADDSRLFDIARTIGADVPVCLASTTRMMTGAGEALGPPLALPPLLAVLVNPGRPVATEQVFRALGLAVGTRLDGAGHPVIDCAEDMDSLVAALAPLRNDLQPPAIAIEPSIAEAIEHIRAQEGCRLVRMSGSGATCFGIFGNLSQTFEAVRNLRMKHSRWWVQPAILGGRYPVRSGL